MEALVVQLVEQQTVKARTLRNLKVVGSIPTWSALFCLKNENLCLKTRPRKTHLLVRSILHSGYLIIRNSICSILILFTI